MIDVDNPSTKPNPVLIFWSNAVLDYSIALVLVQDDREDEDCMLSKGPGADCYWEDFYI